MHISPSCVFLGHSRLSLSIYELIIKKVLNLVGGDLSGGNHR